MSTCTKYQEQVLDHLFGLLEEEESLSLIEHASQCDECRSALHEAGGQKRLIATAARSEFSDVRFTPPGPEQQPRILRMDRQQRKEQRSRWVGWAVAASLFLALGGVLYAFADHVINNINAHHEVELALADKEEVRDAEARLLLEKDKAETLAFRNRDELEQLRAKLEADQKKELQAIEKSISRLDMYIVVTGPSTLRPGEPASYKIETKNLEDKLEPVKLTARVREQTTQRVLFEEKDIDSKGSHELVLSSSITRQGGNNLALEVIAQSAAGPKGVLKENLALVQSALVTHIFTDKPMYQPGEKVRFRSLTLDRFSLKPVERMLNLKFSVLGPDGRSIDEYKADLSTRLVNPAGKAIAGPGKRPIQGICAGEFQLDPDMAGGVYTLVVADPHNRFATEKRKFIVNRYQKPQLNKELKWDKESYGPGQEVVARFEVSRVDGGFPLAGQPVSATVRIDGKEYDAAGKQIDDARILTGTDAYGKGTIRFTLPRNIEKGHASLALEFTDGGGNHESLTKPINIIVDKMQVDFFPEGGDLVAGLPNRVYFQSRNMRDKPAALKGIIVDADGKKVADIQTLNDPKEEGINQGMGSFTFRPRAGVEYELKIQQPTGIKGKFVLPQAKPEGVVLRIPTGVTTSVQPIQVVVHSAEKDRELLVGAYCRGRLLDYQPVEAKAGQSGKVELKPVEGVGGVYRITVFEKLPQAGNRLLLKPVAERLVYRAPSHRLNVAVRSDKREYAPGETVKLTVTAGNEKGRPTPSIVLIGVVDKRVIKMADEKTARSMPTHFLLTHEVQRAEDLEHADILLTDHPKAPVALDLLLGTQGWRRFVESDPQRYRNTKPNKPQTPEERRRAEDVDRLMIANGQMMTAPDERKKLLDSFDQEQERLLAAFKPKFDALQAKFEQAKSDDDKLKSKYREESLALHDKVAEAAHAYHFASNELDKFGAFNARLRSQLLLAFGAILLVAGLGSMLLGMSRGLRRTAPYYATAVASVAVCGLVLLGTFMIGGTSKDDAPTVAMMDADKPVDQWFGVVKQEANGPGRQKADEEINGNAEPDDHSPPKPNQPGLPPRIQRPKAKPQEGQKRPVAGAAGDGKGAEAGEKLAAMLLQNRQAGRDVFLDQRAVRGAALGGGKGQAGFGRRKQNADRKARVEREDLQEKALQKLKEERLRALGDKNGILAKDALKRIPEMKKWAKKYSDARIAIPCIVREYAHITQPNADPYLRTDFTETIFWHPVLVLEQGKAEVSFDLCDSSTEFEIIAIGHTSDGRLGQGKFEITSKLPFKLTPKVPLEVNANDVIDLPVTVANSSDVFRTVNVSIELDGFILDSPSLAEQQLELQPQQGRRILYRLRPTIKEGAGTISVRATSEPFGMDGSRYTVKIVPEGFPVEEEASDVLEQTAVHDLELPKAWVPKTLECELTLYPSTLSELQKGLEGLLREPRGCFEQTSTSNYPNVLILKYLNDTKQSLPAVEQRAEALLKKGYGRLISYECINQGGMPPRHGYEWFGGKAPAHEALTAYGLLQFRDMQRVGFEVNEEMIKRTRDYLLSRRDGQGGFRRNKKALDSFGRAPQQITNAYIIWAITESEQGDPDRDKANINKELDALIKQAAASKDPYFIALVANSMINRDIPAANLLKKLATMQNKQGFVPGAATSITRSGGRTLQIETTALAVLAWLKANQPQNYHGNIQAAVKWIGKQRGGRGGYGSTQSTILALKALLVHANDKSPRGETGTLTLTVNGKKVSQSRYDPKSSKQSVTIPDPGTHFKGGNNVVKIEMSGAKNVLPYTLRWSYNTLQPKSADACPIKLGAKVSRAKVQDGETVQLNLTVENKQKQGQGMVVAIVGLPAGLELPPDFKQLKGYTELKNGGTEPGELSYFEVRGTRELILYWRDMAPEKKIDLNIDLICKVPGDYRGPASRAYLYYNADVKHWIEPIQVAIGAKE